MSAAVVSVVRPVVCVIVAGFQYIDDGAPPAAMPAKDAPCPKALCSRTAKPPACAELIPHIAATIVAAEARLRVRTTDPFIDVPQNSCSRQFAVCTDDAPQLFQCKQKGEGTEADLAIQREPLHRCNSSKE
jgi:hypothetical protein